MNLSFSDEQIIEGIKEKNSLVLRFLYSEYRDKVIKYVMYNSGNKNEAEDVFQDAIIKTYEEVQQKDFVLKKTFNTYFINICRNTWICAVKLRNKKKIITEIFHEEFEEITLFDEYKNEQLQKLIWKQFRQLKEDCQEVLGLYYFQKKTMSEIAYQMDYKNEQIAKNKKFKCLEYLRELLKNHPIYISLTNE